MEKAWRRGPVELVTRSPQLHTRRYSPETPQVTIKLQTPQGLLLNAYPKLAEPGFGWGAAAVRRRRAVSSGPLSSEYNYLSKTCKKKFNMLKLRNWILNSGTQYEYGRMQYDGCVKAALVLTTTT